MNDNAPQVAKSLALQYTSLISSLQKYDSTYLQTQCKKLALGELGKGIIEHQVPIFGFLGPFNSGKSTLINAILGTNILGVSNRPMTSAIIIFRHQSFKPKAWGSLPVHQLKRVQSVRTLADDAVDVSFKLEDLVSLSSYSEDLSFEPRVFVVFLDCDLLKSVALVDVPGTNTFKEFDGASLTSKGEKSVQQQMTVQCDGFFLLSNMQGGAFNDRATIELMELLVKKNMQYGELALTFVGSNADPVRLETSESERLDRVKRDIINICESMSKSIEATPIIDSLASRIVFSYFMNDFEKDVLRQELVDTNLTDISGKQSVQVIFERALLRRERLQDVLIALKEMIPQANRICQRKVIESFKLKERICDSLLASEQAYLAAVVRAVAQREINQKNIGSIDKKFKELMARLSHNLTLCKASALEQFLRKAAVIRSFENIKKTIDGYTGLSKSEVKNKIMIDIRQSLYDELCGNSNAKESAHISYAENEALLFWKSFGLAPEKSNILNFKAFEEKVAFEHTEFRSYLPQTYSSGRRVSAAISVLVGWCLGVGWFYFSIIGLWLLWRTRASIGINWALESHSNQINVLGEKVIGGRMEKVEQEIDRLANVIKKKVAKNLKEISKFNQNEINSYFSDRSGLKEFDLEGLGKILDLASHAKRELRLFIDAQH